MRWSSRQATPDLNSTILTEDPIMSRQLSAKLCLVLFVYSGCATTVTNRTSPIATRSPAPVTSAFQGIKSGFHSAIERVTPDGGRNETICWDWATGIPESVPRAEAVTPVLTAPTLSRIAPNETFPWSVQLASTGPPVDLQVASIQGSPVASFADFHASVAKAAPKHNKIQIDIRKANALADTPATSVSLSPEELVRLEHEIAPASPMLRIMEDGNPWVLIRCEGVSAKLMARVERSHGILQVVLATSSQGKNYPLPVDAHATYNGKPLECLTVSRAMEELYEKRPNRPKPNDLGQLASFAAVSEREDYLIPTNFRKLDESFYIRTKSATAITTPAFVTVPGAAYPGSAVLGDARALSAFLLQKEIHDSTQPQSKVGWIVFGGEELKKAGRLELDLDLGKGPIRLSMNVPRR